MTTRAARQTAAADAADPAQPGPRAALLGRRRWAALAGILLVAFALRLGAVLWLDRTVPYSDWFYYHEAGRMVARDWTFLLRVESVRDYGKLNWWPPGYPVFLGAVYSVLGVHFRAAVFVHVLLGTAVCGLVYAIGRRAAGERAGVVAGLLCAVNPTFIFMTNLIASENLFAFLLALGLWRVGALQTGDAAGARGADAAGGPGSDPGRSRSSDAAGARGRDPTRGGAPRGAKRHAFWTGAVFGLAALTRAAAVPVPLIAAAWLRCRMRGREEWRGAAAWLLAGTALTIAPWTLRNAVVAGSPALICFGGGLNFYFGHNDVALGYREVSTTPMAGLRTAQEIDRRGYRLGLENLAAHPLRFFTRGARKLAALFAPPDYALHSNSAIVIPDYNADPKLKPMADRIRAEQKVKDDWLHGILTDFAALHAYVLLAGALAAVAILRRRLPDECVLALWLCLYWIGAHVVFWAQPRFRYPMEIPMALLAAALAEHARQKLASRSETR